jgi:hypothetical protein
LQQFKQNGFAATKLRQYYNEWRQLGNRSVAAAGIGVLLQLQRGEEIRF